MGENLPEFELSVESSDPIERKLARKYRLEKRLQNCDKDATDNSPEIKNTTEELSKIEEEILKSDEILHELTERATESITAIRVRSDEREVNRRQLEEENRQKILEELAIEEQQSMQKFQSLCKKWSSIMQQNDPLNIYDNLMLQKHECNEVLNGKDNVIKMLHDQLDKLNLQFVKEQDRQTEDIDELIYSMKIQYDIIEKACNNQLKVIEERAYLEQKTAQETKRESWAINFERMEQHAEKLMLKKLDQIEQNDKKLKELTLRYQNYHRDTKRQLEMDINILQKELQKARYACLINREKLDYNFQILKRREDENILIEAHNKRKLNKMQEYFTSLKTNIKERETYLKNEQDRLQKDMQKIKKNIEETKKKTNALIKSEKKKFTEIWELNKREAVEIFEQLILIDKAIYEQLLSEGGTKWREPDKSWLNYQPYYNDGNKRRNSLIEVPIINRSSEITCSIDFINHILEKIADKSGFLVENQLFEILKPYRNYEQKLIVLHHIFMALSVHKTEDFEYLLRLFTPYVFCEICTINRASNITDADFDETKFENLLKTIQQPDEVVNDLIAVTVKMYQDKKSANIDLIVKNRQFTCCKNHYLVVSDEDVLKVMKSFLETIRDKKTPRSNDEEMNSEITVDFIRNYWANFGNYFTVEKQQFWEKTLQSMQKYLEIVSKKHDLYKKHDGNVDNFIKAALKIVHK